MDVGSEASFEMPSDVGSDYDGDAAPAVPSSSDNAAPAGACNCKLKCHTNFDAAEIDTLRLTRLAKSKQDRMAEILQAVRCQICDRDGNVAIGRCEWTHQQRKVCRPFWEYAHAAGHDTVDSMRKLVMEGHNTIPPPLPAMPGKRANLQMYKADAWFLRQYQKLAEPFAMEDGCIDEAEAEQAILECDSHPLWALGQALPHTTHRGVRKLFLNPGCFEDLWGSYEIEQVDDKVSKSTMLKCYNSTWKKIMPFRTAGQGKRCKICAYFDEMRMQAADEEQRREVIVEKQKVGIIV